jgi:catechol 2,3-dioxygenase-like lactoylglutathione lyase family enzyme
MITITSSFSGFSVDDIDAAEQFYSDTIGLKTTKDAMGLGLTMPDGAKIFIYPKENHQPATYTVLNFVVPNIDEAYDALTEKGVKFERYEGMHQDEKGIARQTEGAPEAEGPTIAWFTDPAGNILGLIEDMKK